jgi:hypothetical protein
MIRGRFSIPLVFLGIMLMLAACGSSHSPVQKVGSVNTGTAYAVFVQDNVALVATNDGVVIIDIQQRNHPQKTALIEANGPAFDVYGQGELVYIAAPEDGLMIADIQDETSPKIVSTYPVGGINRVCVHDGVAYASTQQGTLEIINVKDPAQPSALSAYDPQSGIGLLVTCLEDVVYYSTSEKGLDVLDVSEPSSPVRTMTVARTPGAKDIQIVGDLLYLACVGNGVRILNIADPLAPKTIASFNNGGEAWGAGGDSHHLWIGDLKQGIELYDVSNPRSPTLIATNASYAPHDIFFDGEYAYLADQDRGFIILAYVEDDQGG